MLRNVSIRGNTSSELSQISQHKKAKLAGDLVLVDEILSSSPDLHHKQPRSREQQQDKDSEDTGDSCGEDGLDHSNEVYYVV